MIALVLIMMMLYIFSTAFWNCFLLIFLCLWWQKLCSVAMSGAISVLIIINPWYPFRAQRVGWCQLIVLYCGEFGIPFPPFAWPRVTTARRLPGQGRGGQGAVAPRRMSLDITVDLGVGHDFKEGQRGVRFWGRTRRRGTKVIAELFQVDTMIHTQNKT